MAQALGPTLATQRPDRAPNTAIAGSGVPLVLARGAVLLIAACALAAFLTAMPPTYTRLQIPCTLHSTQDCQVTQLPVEAWRALHTLGISPARYAQYVLVLHGLFGAIYSLVATILIWRRTSDRAALFTALTLLLFGMVTFSGDVRFLALRYPVWTVPLGLLDFGGYACFVVFLYLFPGWRIAPHWTRWAMLGWIPYQLPNYLWPDAPFVSGRWPLALQALMAIFYISATIFAQVYRYRRISTVIERQQTKWAVFGIAVALTGNLGANIAAAIISTGAWTPQSVVALLVLETVNTLSMLLIPIAIAFAILRYRLFDVDLLMSRTLVYAALTGCVAALYAIIVGGCSLLVQGRGQSLFALFGTGAVAVLFHPLRQRLQRGVNRLLYGQRDEPYTVLSRLGQQLEASLTPDQVLPTLVSTVRQALRLPYAGISLLHDGYLAPMVEEGEAADDLLRLPLVYASETVGELALAPRARGDSWTAADRRLLDDVARQAGAAVYAVRQFLRLQSLNEDLLRSRTALIETREEERRRLRRDLHDGLGSALTAIIFGLGGAQATLRRDPAAVAPLLADLKKQTQDTIADVRRLVYNLRPPILDELGLTAALREYVSQHHLNGLVVDVDAPERLPTLPAAIELAAYRVALEALANVLRHAQAHLCRVRIQAGRGTLHLEVDDDGRGLPLDWRPGVGMAGMRERAAEIGGTLLVTNSPLGGVHIEAKWPLREE